MSIYGTAGQATYSVSYANLDLMLTDLKDNTSNAIRAQEVRNAVYTLWQLSSSSSVSSGAVNYVSVTPSTITVGGITKGTVFTSSTIQQVLDLMLKPYVEPSIDYLRINYNNSGSYSSVIYREYGSPTSSFYTSFSITQGSVTIVSNPFVPNAIRFSGVPSIAYNGVAGTWYPNILATQSGVISIPSNQDITLTLSINDLVGTYSATASIVYRNKIYWGSTNSTTSFNSSNILSLNGAEAGVGNELTDTRIRSFNGINGNGEYLVFALPKSFGTPSFVTNGMLNTAFTKTELNFVNSYSYSASYSVWYSNTVQNSPINLFEII